MPMEVNVRRVPLTDGWKNATVSDPQEFMVAAFKIADLARDVTNAELNEEKWERAVDEIMAAACDLACAVYGEFYTSKGDI